ncbi:uncharacterized protein STEHIDRAFT_121687 [Stereum hirsutum FP-91666 SS1]|uniref:uncharacterized protein n=1 Tax=Stereum hirsutum (strain FP-91666) TaxID=721885 RepID=UPI000444A83C|nr:uncharacterized protein STEHIDRAFT_121687 [Stereum hirsutum FP-91666 SS1]EIM86839.1 hypothetical protein STEHIDRAFT_121687 [Stereum hirsutum FP-91666 SS1]
MPILDGYYVAVTDQYGRELDHYNIMHEGPNALSCYIASEEGMEFKIKYYDDSDDGWTIKVMVDVDGHPLGYRNADPGGGVTVDSTRTSATTEAAFQFGRVQLVDEDDLNPLDETGDPVVPRDIGLIEVKLVRGRRVPRHGPQIEFVPRPVRQTTAISEKWKKGGHHITNLGAIRTVSNWRPSNSKVVTIDPPRHPYKYFRIYYRPKEILMAEGIMPKSNPAPRPRDRERAHREHDGSRRNYYHRDREHDDSSRDYYHRDRDAPRRAQDYSVAAFADRLDQPERRRSPAREDRRYAGTERGEELDTHRRRESERAMSTILREVPEMYLPRTSADTYRPATFDTHQWGEIRGDYDGHNHAGPSRPSVLQSDRTTSTDLQYRSRTEHTMPTATAGPSGTSTFKPPNTKTDPSTPLKTGPPEVIDLTYLSDSD